MGSGRHPSEKPTSAMSKVADLVRPKAGLYAGGAVAMPPETICFGSPSPMQIPLVAAKQLPKGDHLIPIAPQTWHLRQSLEYSLTANRAVLDYASRHREQLLYNIWPMG